MSKSIRCFIGIEMPEDVKTFLGLIIADLMQKLPSGYIRWVSPCNIHLTLKFIGEISEEKILPVKIILESICNNFEGFPLEIDGFGIFPNINRPRILLCKIALNQEVRDIQSMIENELIKKGLSKTERNFTPHLTLGRVNVQTKYQSIASLFNTIRFENKPGSFQVNQITLFQSILDKSGAKYSPLARFALIGGNQE